MNIFVSYICNNRSINSNGNAITIIHFSTSSIYLSAILLDDETEMAAERASLPTRSKIGKILGHNMSVCVCILVNSSARPPCTHSIHHA